MGYMIMTCGNCGEKSDADSWIDPAVEKLPDGVIQCPACKARVRKRVVSWSLVGGWFIPDRFELDVELPPYVHFKDRIDVKSPFRKKTHRKR